MDVEGEGEDRDLQVPPLQALPFLPVEIQWLI